MAESQQSPVYWFPTADPEMLSASEKARAAFRYFWREVAWDRRRIVKFLDLAYVKAPFSDGERPTPEDYPEEEQMWLGDVDFDGQFVTGVLLNAPNWLKSVKKGDAVRVPLQQIADWMYASDGQVYGAYTVNLMRSRMGEQERTEHDEAWGLNFGDPQKIRVVPEWKKSADGDDPDQEHPMSEAIAPSLTNKINPYILRETDDRGWTLLHHFALAGSAACVKVLLESGAAPRAVAHNGMMPLQLARSLGWDKVIALLVSHGG
jgi:uncharacterized protein YegJ (DUF2314 family)